MSEIVEYLRIAEGEPLPDVVDFAPFRAVIAAEAPTSEQWRDEVGAWLIRGGCFYVMAWGQACGDWHDAVDWANIMAFDPNPVPDARHVMTTWHEDEPLDEVFWFAQFCASHPFSEFAATLILHVSPVAARDAMLRRFAEARDRV